jgi:general secretion pathway protein G
MVVIAIIGLLAAMIIPNLMDNHERARRQTAVADVSQIHGAAMSFRLKKGRWPDTLEELIAGRPPEIPGYKSVPKDPWGSPYRIEPGGELHEWAVLSDGPDREEGGIDDISSNSKDGD